MWKVRKEFWPVLLAALIVNLLALAVPLFTMNVYDRVIPNKAVPTLWVLAIGVLLALGFDFILRLARSQLVDEIGRRLDAKYSQKLFEKVMNLPMAERQGSTGAFAKRVSEYEGVRDFFASTSVVLLVDIAFLIVFLVLIAVLAGPLVLVPIAGIAIMLTVGVILQKRMASTAIDAQADSSLQHSVLVESIAGIETLVQRIQNRGVMEMDTSFRVIAQYLTEAAKEMVPAQRLLAQQRPDRRGVLLEQVAARVTAAIAEQRDDPQDVGFL